MSGFDDLDRSASTRSARSRSTPSRRRTRGTRACRWARAPMAYVLWQRHLRARPARSALARSRSLRAVGRPRLDAALLAAPPHRLRPLARRAQAVPAVGQQDAGPPRARHDTPGVEATTGPLGQGARTRSAWRSRSATSRDASTGRPHDHRSPHVRARLRRRHDGGRRLRGRVARRPPRARQADLPLRRQPRHARRPALDSRSPRTSARASRRTAGTSSTSRTATRISRRSTRDRARRRPRPSGRRIIIVRTHDRLRLAEEGRDTARRTARRSATRRSPRPSRRSAGIRDARSSCPTRCARTCARPRARQAAQHAEWRERLRRVRDGATPSSPRELERAIAGELPEGWDDDAADLQAGEAVATRTAGRARCWRRSRAKVPWLVGGDADLGGSTKTIDQGGGDFEPAAGERPQPALRHPRARDGRDRNGMLYHGGVRAVRRDVLRVLRLHAAAVRLAALNKLPAIFVWTHDSVGLGEDGPTHQPVEHLMALRAMPNLVGVPARATATRRPRLAGRARRAPTARPGSC